VTDTHGIDPQTVEELLRIARDVAREAGELAIEGRAGAHIAGTKSAATDIVTQMDIAVERLITRRLSELRPQDGILGEEGASSGGISGITWIVDPIDGTVNYLYGLPHWGVSIAAAAGSPDPREWTLLAGAVYDGTRTLWSAGRGLGSWRDETPLKRTDAAPLSQSLLATGFQYVASWRAAQARVVAQILPQVRDIRRLGACSVDLCLVAAGDLDVYYENGLNPWDFAAGALVAEEAGVRIGAADGGPAHHGLLIAAMPRVWEELRDAIVAAGGESPWDTPTV